MKQEKEISGIIEGLIDEYVRVRKDIHDFMVSSDMPTYVKGCDIYGALWTDKGLIYIAKLNDKKEWELL